MTQARETPASHNPELQLARDFVRHTRSNIFLTGKAGTGKTTFLHKLKHDTPKRMIVTAPTGVAAINAGGVTLHSFFQLPFGPQVPGSNLQQRRFTREKTDIIKGLDLLVIDEISMVRADLLDCVDAVLRRHKHRERPFGGVQLLMIGDLHQLSPVVKADDWQLLKPYYDSCYFFSSQALKQTDMVSIELKTIYRQSDADFIELLNRVRDNRLDPATLQTLNSRYQPDFEPGRHADYITLTTHNRKADQINERQLQALSSEPLSYAASIEGDYPAYSYPTAETLVLKKGGQVMFVRNDTSAEKRYYNGKIGRIVRLDAEHITVQCPNDEQEITVEPVTWKNIKYTLDEKTKDISEEVIGSFTQMPLRLAWSVTIHKSQGLTFERAIIDAQAAFSHGQVYVALSRCKTFEGMVLSSPLSPKAVKTDATVARFVDDAGRNPPTEHQLTAAKIAYQQQLLLECFDFHPIANSLGKLSRQLQDNRDLIESSAIEPLSEVERQFGAEIFVVADKFKHQLQSLFKNDVAPEDDAHLQERVQKASAYFSEKLKSTLTQWVDGFGFETDNREIRKQINKALETLRRRRAVKSAALRSCRDGFATAGYLDAVARAEIDSSARPTASQQPDDAGATHIQHPQLLQALKAWRADQAAEQQVEHYRILHQRVLMQIADRLPDTLQALRQIQGVGKATVEKYGAQITTIVSDYCREHAVEPQQTPVEPAVKNKTGKNTKQISYELFLQGKSIQEIADARGLVRNTIETHLAHFVSLGELNINELVPKDKIALIKQAAEAKGLESLSLIKEHLGDRCSYGEIRLVVESMRH